MNTPASVSIAIHCNQENLPTLDYCYPDVLPFMVYPRESNNSDKNTAQQESTDQLFSLLSPISICHDPDCLTGLVLSKSNVTITGLRDSQDCN